VLQSTRLDARTSFAAGFVEDDRLLLFPIDEVRGAGMVCVCVSNCVHERVCLTFSP
jgi:hypothetical protein